MTAPVEQRDKAEIVVATDVAHRYALERERMSLDAGALGKFFGTAANAPTNIAGLLSFLLTATAVVLMFVPSEKANMTAGDFLQRVLPVITLALGYVFGRKT